MNDQLTNKRLSPQRAIIVYRDKTNYAYKYFLETREIKNVDGKYLLMAPVPMANNVMKDIARSYVKSNSVEMQFKGMIEPHLIHASNRTGLTAVMWYRPAMKRSLNFSASTLHIKGDCNVHTPATLYLVINTTLYIWAMMTSERPNMKTKLYNAPYFNIYKDGNVCLGTARVGQKTKSFEQEAERFERAFYMAEQSGGHRTGTCKTEIAKLWKDLIKKKTPFPSKAELVQHEKFKTLGDVFAKLIGNNTDDHDEE